MTIILNLRWSKLRGHTSQGRVIIPKKSGQVVRENEIPRSHNQEFKIKGTE